MPTAMTVSTALGLAAWAAGQRGEETRRGAGGPVRASSGQRHQRTVVDAWDPDGSWMEDVSGEEGIL
jgi:hypothetical protein